MAPGNASTRSCVAISVCAQDATANPAQGLSTRRPSPRPRAVGLTGATAPRRAPGASARASWTPWDGSLLWWGPPPTCQSVMEPSSGWASGAMGCPAGAGSGPIARRLGGWRRGGHCCAAIGRCAWRWSSVPTRGKAAELTVDTVRAWMLELTEVERRMGARLARWDVRRRARASLRGLRSPVERNNGWQLAAGNGDDTPYGAQHVLGRARWDAEAVRDDWRG